MRISNQAGGCICLFNWSNQKFLICILCKLRNSYLPLFLTLSSWFSLNFKDSPKRNFSPRASTTLNLLPTKKNVKNAMIHWKCRRQFLLYHLPLAKCSPGLKSKTYQNLSPPSSDNLALPSYSTFNAWMCQSCAQCTSFQLSPSCKDGESQCHKCILMLVSPQVDDVIWKLCSSYCDNVVWCAMMNSKLS